MRKRSSLILLSAAVAAGIAYAPPGEAKVRIRFAHWDQNPFIQSVVKAFNGSQSTYEVVYETADTAKILVSLAGGSAPAVFTANWCGSMGSLGVMMDTGVLKDLNQYMNRDKADLRIDDFSKPLLDAGRLKGKTFALPFEDIGTNCIWYNSDLYRTSGLAVPPDNWTVQDALQNAAKLTKDTNGDGKLDQAGFIPFVGWYEARVAAMVLASGGMYYSSDRRNWVGDSPENAKALRLLESLMTKTKMTAWGTSFGGWSDFFSMGKTGMWVRDACLTAIVTTTGKKWNFAVAPPPALDDTGMRGKQDAQGTYVVIPNSAKKREADGAWAFMKFWTSEAGVKAQWEAQGWVQRPLPRASLSAKYFVHPKDSKYSSMRLENFLKYKDTVVTSENWPYKKADRATQLLQDGWSRVAMGKSTTDKFLADVSPVLKRLLAQN